MKKYFVTLVLSTLLTLNLAWGDDDFLGRWLSCRDDGLSVAVSNGDLESVTAILEQSSGASNHCGSNLIEVAMDSAKRNGLETALPIIYKMIEAGTKHINDLPIKEEQRYGLTPLFYIIYKGFSSPKIRLELVKFALERGAALHERDKWGNNALDIADFVSDPLLIEFFFIKGLRGGTGRYHHAQEFKDRNPSWSSLHRVVQYSNDGNHWLRNRNQAREVVELLIKEGVSIHAIDSDGNNAHDLAIQNRNLLMIDIFRDLGLMPNRRAFYQVDYSVFDYSSVSDHSEENKFARVLQGEHITQMELLYKMLKHLFGFRKGE